ncbi:Hypothetical protein UVM_LOCUS226 [uncultured virus]|nr:Hypothetical protein UVM_LOCUS226 [uncultured virus]
MYLARALRRARHSADRTSVEITLSQPKVALKVVKAIQRHSAFYGAELARGCNTCVVIGAVALESRLHRDMLGRQLLDELFDTK